MTVEAPPSADLKPRATQVLHAYDAQMVKCESQWTGLTTFTPTPTDIFIATFAKAGTTLLQQLVYQLLVCTNRVPTDPTGTAFEDIGEVVPFVDASPVTGVANPIHTYSPRAWKSHATADAFPFQPHIGRFICCVRNGLHTAPSFLDFTLDWSLREPVMGKELREEVYYQYFMTSYLGLEAMPDGAYKRHGKALGKWFNHVKSWMETKRDNMLWLVYEDIVDDLPGTIRRIAKFVDIEVTDELVEQVASRCSREAMSGDSRFRDLLMARGMDWDINGGNRARAKDAPGFKRVKLPGECVAVYNDMFYDAFGVREYDELAKLVRGRNID